MFRPLVKSLSRMVCLVSMGAALAACGTLPDGTAAWGDPTVPSFAAASASRVGANGTSLFVEPDDGTAPILGAISGAQRSIQLEVYMLTDADVVNGLIAAKQRGVRVQVILDRKPFTTNGQNPNQGAFTALSQAGVAVQWSDPRFTYTHEKAMVVDGSEVLILTLNLTNNGMTANREYGVIDAVPRDVAEVAAVFQADWTGGAYSPSDPALVVSPDDSRQRLTALISSARRSIVVQDEECNDPALDGLLGQKARAGVQVQVEVAALAGGTSAKEVTALHAAGVPAVKVLQAPYLHAKLVIVDGQVAYVGSVNLSANSMDHNREVGILLDDPSEVGRLVQVAQQDWAAGS